MVPREKGAEHQEKGSDQPPESWLPHPGRKRDGSPDERQAAHRAGNERRGRLEAPSWSEATAEELGDDEQHE
jgi:hypothetical protein